jgi:hypothetical protein
MLGVAVSILCLLISLPRQDTLSLEADTVVIQALKHFNMSPPYIIQSGVTIGREINIFKAMFKEAQSGTISFLNGPNITKNNAKNNGLCTKLFLLQHYSNIMANNFEPSNCIALIFAPTKVIEVITSNVNLQLNQEVYFLDSSSLEVFESYQVNSIKIFRRLGIFVGPTMYAFQAEVAVEQNFIKRRSNFMGVTLKGMTETEAPLLLFEDNYKSIAPFFVTNRTFDVTGLVQGMYFEVLKILEEQLNFTTRLFKREDGVWGSGFIQDNGSFKTSGMITNLVEGSADILASSLGIVYPRNLFVDYLPPISYDVGALHIKNNDDITDGLDLTTFIEPFSLGLWIVILVSASTITAIIYFIAVALECRDPMTPKQIPGKLWTCLMVYMGGKHGPSKLDSVQSYKVIIFTSLISGTVVWISYRAFLTSELALATKVFPFHDFESLANTNYRYTRCFNYKL